MDDPDGSKAVETVAFGLDGVGDVIDLSAKNARTLRRVFDEFVAAAQHLEESPRTLPSGRADEVRQPVPTPW